MMEKLHIVPKGWGFEKWIVNNEKYCGKLLYFVKDRKCSWHYHKIKGETFYVQSGRILLYYGWHEEIDLAHKILLRKGDHFHIPVGLKHQMQALEDTELFEFSTQHFDDDSYRIEKGD
jgi:quercetin dioxygenase-like cupin family protein